MPLQGEIRPQPLFTSLNGVLECGFMEERTRSGEVLSCVSSSLRWNLLYIWELQAVLDEEIWHAYMICKEYSRWVRMKDLCAAVGSWLKTSSPHRLMWLTWWSFPFWCLYPPQVPKAICVSRFRERFFNRRDSGGVTFATSSLCASTSLVNSKNSFDEDCLISSSVRLYTSESAVTSSSDRPGYPFDQWRPSRIHAEIGAGQRIWWRFGRHMIQDNLHLPENPIENSYMPGASEERWKKRGYQNFTGSLLMGVLRTDPALQR